MRGLSLYNIYMVSISEPNTNWYVSAFCKGFGLKGRVFEDISTHVVDRPLCFYIPFLWKSDDSVKDGLCHSGVLYCIAQSQQHHTKCFF